jgi:transcriptional regulator with XRE-family HTH domain
MSALNRPRLKAARMSLGVSQGDVSKALGVAPGLAGDWERGSREPSLGRFRELALYLGVSADWLLELEQRPAGRAREVRDSRRSRELVLSDYQSPAGLRDLAEDAGLVRALQVRGDEWEALHRLGADLSKAGYLAVLGIIRQAGGG